MKTATRFKKGDMVRVVNPSDHFYDEIAEIIMFDEPINKYYLQFANGYKCNMYQRDLVKHLSHDELRKLHRAQLIQIADLALEFKDRGWFNDVCSVLKTL